MRNKKQVQALAAVVMLLVASSMPAVEVPRKTQVTLSGALLMFQASGQDSDYLAGSNDFPVTPAYQVPAAGIGLAFFSSRTFAFGFSVRYGLSTQVDLRDPSDGEVIQTDTPKSLMAVLNLLKYFPLSAKMQLVVSAGGGSEYRMADDKEFISNLGNMIIIGAPEKPFSPLAAAGVGLQYMLSGSLGLSVEFQGVYVFRDSAQLLISPALALVLKF